jgi:hypothetical protein
MTVEVTEKPDYDPGTAVVALDVTILCCARDKDSINDKLARLCGDEAFLCNTEEREPKSYERQEWREAGRP